MRAFAGLAAAWGFHAIGGFYRDWRQPYGVGLAFVPVSELAFLAWYLLFGLVTLACFTRVALATGLGDALAARGRWLRAAAVRAALAVVLLAALVAARRWVVLAAPLTDDEMTYRFIAQTLLAGHVANPPPPAPFFFQNQFVACDDHGWYGKYPLGHPLALALGMRLGAEDLVGPVITTLAVCLTWSVGRRCFSAREAALGCVLAGLSPQLTLTGATALSQPLAMLCTLAGVLALYRFEEGGGTRWAQGAGLAFGAGVLVRPMPGVLFLAVGLAWLWRAARRAPGGQPVAALALAALPVAGCAAVMLAVNALQTGSPLTTGYHVVHGGLGILPERVEGATTAGIVAASVGGGFLRQSFWLFGCPLSVALVPLARRTPRAALLWALIAAEYVYRVVVPKTVVSTTGPIYLAEIVPLLALLTASGLCGLRWALRRHRLPAPRGLVPALVVAAVATAALDWWPVHVREIRRAAAATRVCAGMLEGLGVSRALVFANQLTDLAAAESWAVFAPNPSPALDDPVIYARWPVEAPGRAAAIQLWRQRFADRPAYCFRWVEHRAVLKRVEQAADLELH